MFRVGDNVVVVSELWGDKPLKDRIFKILAIYPHTWEDEIIIVNSDGSVYQMISKDLEYLDQNA